MHLVTFAIRMFPRKPRLSASWSHQPNSDNRSPYVGTVLTPPRGALQ